MPVENYQGDTFVAFLDISGFKILMRDEQRALRALDQFYETGFRVLHNQSNMGNSRIDGFFVSDSGILFVRSDTGVSYEQLEALLDAIEQINRRMLGYDFMLTCSVAYGRFSYHGRFEFTGIEKNPIYGNAYVHAFLDNENGTPKIQPGQCRIIKRGLPATFENLSEHLGSLVFRRLRNKDRHYYFYWMVDNEGGIEDFEKRYNDTYDLKYAGMLQALKVRNA